MRYLLTIFALIGALAGCAGSGAGIQQAAAPQGIPLVPIAGDGVELVVFEVTHLKRGDGRFNYLVSFKLTNQRHDQLEVTGDALRLVSGDGQEFEPNLINPYSPDDSQIVAKGASESFTAGFDSPAEGGLVFRYAPPAGAAPLLVAVDGPRADRQGKFYGLPLAPAVESSFSAPLAAAVRSTKSDVPANSMFPEPASYLQADIAYSGAELGSITIDLYDDSRIAPAKLDRTALLFGAGERHRIEEFDQPSMYYKARDRKNGRVLVKGGFVQCHAVVDLLFTADSLEQLPDDETAIAALVRLRDQLEPLACP
ncbi:MAG TPA: hypothetical protein VGE07_19755 [Herpetosiphonaceae bacterium]